MGVFYETIPKSLVPWILEQQMLWVYVLSHLSHSLSAVHFCLMFPSMNDYGYTGH